MSKRDFNKVAKQLKSHFGMKSHFIEQLKSRFIEITLWHGCSPVNLLHIFRTFFTKNTSERPLLKLEPRAPFKKIGFSD